MRAPARTQVLAGALHDPAERYARRARGLARAAHEARLEVAGDRLGGWSVLRDHLADELDPAARRIGLVAEYAIRRAIVEAQTARDAGREVVAAHV